MRAGRVVALWLGAYDYEALSVGFSIGIYGLIGIKYVLAALNKYAAIIVNERGKIVLSCLWFLVLSGPVLFGGVWLFLQPFPKTTWYGRLIYVVVAIGLVIAGSQGGGQHWLACRARYINCHLMQGGIGAGALSECRPVPVWASAGGEPCLCHSFELQG
jgi:hypothetical protein